MKSLTMGILLMAFIIGYLQSYANCQTTDTEVTPGQEVFMTIVNTLNSTTASVDLMLRIYESMDLKINRSKQRDLAGDNLYDLRNAKVMNKELFDNLVNVYYRVLPLVDWQLIQFPQRVVVEWQHNENYSKVLREELDRIYKQVIDKTANRKPEQDSAVSCQLMPLGPPRNFKIVESMQEGLKRKALTERSNLHELMKNVEEALLADITFNEIVTFQLVWAPEERLDDEDQIVDTIMDLLWQFKYYVERVIEDANNATDLFIDDYMVQKSKSLTMLVTSMRDSLEAVELFDRSYSNLRTY